MSDRILIIGGGLGGLTLAQGLKKSGIPFHVFERDPTPIFRAQGYRLRISTEGAAALKSNLTPELYDLFEQTCAEMIVGGAQYDALTSEVTSTGLGPPPSARGAGKPHTADRVVLRTTLMKGLEGDLSFGKEFTTFEFSETGITAHFTDGTSVHGALLVGADGIRSTVRKQYLPNHKPVDTNGRCIYGKTPLTSALSAHFLPDALEDKGMCLAQDNTRSAPLVLLEEPIRFQSAHINPPENYVYWVLVSNSEVFATPDSTLLRLSGEEAAELSLRLTKPWHPTIRSLLELQDRSQCAALRITSMDPTIPAWEPSARVTLLGDAIHNMPPTGGVGANTALKDAGLLAGILREEGATRESVRNYEALMREYAGKAIEGSLQGARRFYGLKDIGECKVADM